MTFPRISFAVAVFLLCCQALAAPLHDAARAGDVAAATRLLAEGAKPDDQDAQGYAALHHAVDEGRIEIVTLLLERGANPNIVALAGIAPLHLAAMRGRPRSRCC